MINLKVLDKEFNNYKTNKEFYEKYKQEIELMYEKNKGELDRLLDIYNEIKTKIEYNYINYRFKIRKILSMLKLDNKLLADYLNLKYLLHHYEELLEECISNTNITDDENQRFVILLHKDKKILMDLYSREEIDVSSFGKEKIEFLIEILKNRHSFIGYITRDDLPLLMNILEDIDEKVSYSDMDHCDIEEEKYLNETSKCHDIYLEFKRAHMFDNNEQENNDIVNRIEIPFDLNEEMSKLFKNKYTMEREDFLEKFYTLLILRNRNVENIFFNIPEANRKYLINAYYKLSTYKEHKTLEENRMHLRTASPVINCEVLKLLYKKKKI